ncbi:MAG: TIGR00296 family protein [Halobacteriaceae archaeon]
MSDAQPVDLSYDDGARAVELARESVESYVVNGQREQPGSMRDAFYNRTGVLVRLVGAGGRLRGCAGACESDDQLGRAIVEAAIGAASGDSCGSEVEPAELPSVSVSVFVVSDVVLTDDPERDLEVGRHAAVVEGGDGDGWLYPTVPLENGWSPMEYLDRTCRTAGLPPTAWSDEEVGVTLFDGQVFRERSPGGEIETLGAAPEEPTA